MPLGQVIEKLPEPGSYTIKNPKTGLRVDLKEGSTADNADIVGWEPEGFLKQANPNQVWNIDVIEEKHFFIIWSNKAYGKCLDVAHGDKSDRARVCSYTYHGADNQHWRRKVCWDGDSVLINVATGTVLSLDGGEDSGRGTKVCMRPVEFQSMTYWELSKI